MRVNPLCVCVCKFAVLPEPPWCDVRSRWLFCVNTKWWEEYFHQSLPKVWQCSSPEVFEEMNHTSDLWLKVLDSSLSQIGWSSFRKIEETQFRWCLDFARMFRGLLIKIGSFWKTKKKNLWNCFKPKSNILLVLFCFGGFWLPEQRNQSPGFSSWVLCGCAENDKSYFSLTFISLQVHE